MKTSNIIIIAFATFILAGMLILFVDAKQFQKKQKAAITFKEFALPAFSVVVAEKGSDVHLDQSDSTYIKVEYLKDKPVTKKMYKVSNDTLYVYGGLRTFVKCSKLKAIRANKPFWMGVSQFKLDSLHIKICSGSLNFYANDSIKTEIKKLVINASDSANINTSNIKVENFVLNAKDKTICEMYGKFKHVYAKLSNNSTLFFNSNPQSIKFERDTTSGFRIY